MFSSDVNLVPTMIGFGMSAGFIVFVCTRIICRKAQGFDPETEFRTDLEQVILHGTDLEQVILHRIQLEQQERRAAGLQSDLISAIPIMKFNRETFSSVEDAQCSICLEEYEEGDNLRIMPKCGHKFHVSCIDVWFNKQSTCPVCRFPLQNDSDTTKYVSAL